MSNKNAHSSLCDRARCNILQHDPHLPKGSCPLPPRTQSCADAYTRVYMIMYVWSWMCLCACSACTLMYTRCACVCAHVSARSSLCLVMRCLHNTGTHCLTTYLCTIFFSDFAAVPMALSTITSAASLPPRIAPSIEPRNLCFVCVLAILSPGTLHKHFFSIFHVCVSVLRVCVSLSVHPSCALTTTDYIALRFHQLFWWCRQFHPHTFLCLPPFLYSCLVEIQVHLLLRSPITRQSEVGDGCPLLRPELVAAGNGSIHWPRRPHYREPVCVWV